MNEEIFILSVGKRRAVRKLRETDVMVSEIIELPPKVSKRFARLVNEWQAAMPDDDFDGKRPKVLAIMQGQRKVSCTLMDSRGFELSDPTGDELREAAQAFDDIAMGRRPDLRRVFEARCGSELVAKLIEEVNVRRAEEFIRHFCRSKNVTDPKEQSKTVRGYLGRGWSRLVEDWVECLSADERAVYDRLNDEDARAAFRIVRKTALEKDGEDFPLNTGILGWRLCGDWKVGSDARKALLKVRAIRRTERAVPCQRSARFEWVAGEVDR